MFGTSKYKEGLPIKDWDTKQPDFDRILKEENENEAYINSQHGKLVSDSQNKLSELDRYNNNEFYNDKNRIDGSGGFMRPEDYPSDIEPVEPSPKKVPIHPKDIPMLKTEKLFSYDTIQLVESLKFIEFKKSNLNKFINMLAVIRKKRDMKIYDFPEILNMITYIRNNLDSITPSYIISFIYSLSKIQSFNVDRPTLNNQTLVYDVLAKLMENLNAIDIRGMSNLVYSLHSFQQRNAQVYNFDEFLVKLEEPIIQKISQFRKTITSQDITNIILAYCKTQNGSEEFYRLLQEVVVGMKSLLSPQDVAVVLYSYSNNPTCNEKVLEDLEEVVKSNLSKYKPKELINVLRAYHMRKLLSEDLKKLIMATFIEKHELSNSQDLAHFYVILAEENNQKFLKYSSQCLTNLYFTFSGYELGIIFEKSEFIQANQPDIYSLLQKQVSKIIKKNEFKGHDLKLIYLNVKDLPFEGKYNLFVEQIEQHLQKLKYY